MSAGQASPEPPWPGSAARVHELPSNEARTGEEQDYSQAAPSSHRPQPAAEGPGPPLLCLLTQWGYGDSSISGAVSNLFIDSDKKPIFTSVSRVDVAVNERAALPPALSAKLPAKH